MEVGPENQEYAAVSLEGWIFLTCVSIDMLNAV